MTTHAWATIFKPCYPVDISTTSLISALSVSSKPRGFKLAARSPEWLTAMQEEIDLFRSNQTWDLISRPPYTNIVGSKWIFRTKYHSDGLIERHKGRLVAQCFTQILGTDFGHTFSFIVKASTVRVILALFVQYK